MCFKSKTTSSSTQTQTVPTWLEDTSKVLADKAETVASAPFQAYTGDRVADFSGDQRTAFQALRDMVSGGSMSEDVSRYTDAPAQNIQTERVVDENGRLGAISDYMNPYTEQALQPVLRKIQEQADAQRKRIGSQAATAGAFGDARHGVLESTLNSNTSQAMGDTASQFFMNAFNQAMGQRAADLGRFGAADQANAQFNEVALERALKGATAEQGNMLQQIQALLSAGTMQQGNEQADLDALYQEFLREYGHDAAMLGAASGALPRLPYTKTVDGTSTQTQPNNSGLGLIGSILGAI